MKTKLERLITTMAHLILRRSEAICALGLLLGIAGAYFTFRLYSDLRTGLEELLPSTSPSVVDYQRIGTRLKSVENLVVLIFSSDHEGSKRFVTALAHRLATLPKDLVAGVEYRADKEIDFFRKRAALFLDYEDLRTLKRYTEQKIAYEKETMGLGLGLGLIEAPTLDFAAMKHKYARRTDWADRFPDGYFATKDQTCRLIIVNLSGRAGDIEAARRLKAAVETAIAELKPKSFARDLEVRYTGNTQNFIEEHSAIVDDVKFSSVAVLIFVLTSLWIYFGSVMTTLALVSSAAVGTLCTLGASFFITGHLNANSAFLSSIVLGNGINFGIILLARYLEERHRYRNHLRSLLTAMKRSFKATLAAALAAGAAYGSLMLTDFRGLNQFGRIGLTGMLVCWATAFTLLPAVLQIMHFRRWLSIPKRRVSLPSPTEYLARLLDRHPKKTAVVCLAVTLGMALSFLLNKREVLELDMNRLRDRDSLQSGAGFYYHYISDIFGKNLSATVLLTETREEAQHLATVLRAKKEREGEGSQIAWVQTLDDMVPPDQPQKLRLLAEFRQLLKPSVRKFVPQEYRSFARTVVESEGIEPFSETDLSPALLEKFTERDGRRGNLVLVDKPVVAQGQQENALVTVDFVRSLRQAASEVNPKTAAAGYLPVTADMITAIKTAGPRATLLAGLAVLFIIAIFFRDVKTVALVTFSLWMGVFWMAGVILWLEIKINFLNFIALPITFGIGMDYGVNIFQRYREGGSKNLLDAVRHTGGAVALCSLTTVIGYTSLLMAGNQAFVSFGIMAVLGELCCALTAIVFLPAILRSSSSFSSPQKSLKFLVPTLKIR